MGRVGDMQTQQMDRITLKLDMLVRAFAELQAAADEAARNLNLVKETLLNAMEEEQVKTHEVTEGGKVYRATYTQATTAQIDEKGLREDLGDDLVDAYCKKVLDRTKIEVGMEEGLLDPFVVGRHVTERKNKPSVRFSARAADDS